MTRTALSIISCSGLWAIESLRPDPWNLAGASLCLIGAAVILFGPRGWLEPRGSSVNTARGVSLGS